MNARKHYVILAVFIFMAASLTAQTYISGAVSGVWDSTGSPYYITDSTWVPVFSSLRIEPGVEVAFTGHHRIVVNVLASFDAIGTEEDSIVFTALDTFLTDTGGGYDGIAFDRAQEGCTLSYCKFEYGNRLSEADIVGNPMHPKPGILEFYSTSVNIAHCSFCRNRVQRRLLSFYTNLRSSSRHNVVIKNSKFFSNYGPPFEESDWEILLSFDRGKLNVELNELEIFHNEISHLGYFDGGIYMDSMVVDLSNLSIRDNILYRGLYYHDVKLDLRYSTFTNNISTFLFDLDHYSHSEIAGVDKVFIHKNIFSGNTVVARDSIPSGLLIQLRRDYPYTPTAFSENLIISNTCEIGALMDLDGKLNLYNNVIAYNSVHDGSLLSYCGNEEKPTTSILNNLFYSNQINGPGIEMQWCGDRGDTSQVAFMNNIWWNNDCGEILNIESLPATPEFSFRKAYIYHNLIDTAASEYSAISPDSIYLMDGLFHTDPMFRGLDSLDFYPLEESPIIDAGADSIFIPEEDGYIHAPRTDLLGNIRPCGEGIDLGPIEYCPDNINDKPFVIPSLIKLFPNPFHASCNIDIAIGSRNLSSSNVILEIYDLNGRRIEQIEQVPYTWIPSPSDNPGVYLLKLKMADWEEVKKVVYIK